MNWVDLCVLAILGVSAVLSLLRGLVREALGIGAWVGAGIAGAWGAPALLPRLEGTFADPVVARWVAFGAVFLVVLAALLLVANTAGRLARSSALGGLDRTLGLLFGLLRGAALLVVAYIAFGWLIPPDHWPDPVLRARTLPLVHDASVWVAERLPPAYRLDVAPLNERAKATAAALLHAIPVGRATGPRPVRE